MSNVGHNIPEMIMFDWFHIYLVHDVAGNEVGLLLGRLRDNGYPEQDIPGLCANIPLACAVRWRRGQVCSRQKARGQDCTGQGGSLRAP